MRLPRRFAIPFAFNVTAAHLLTLDFTELTSAEALRDGIALVERASRSEVVIHSLRDLEEERVFLTSRGVTLCRTAHGTVVLADLREGLDFVDRGLLGRGDTPPPPPRPPPLPLPPPPPPPPPAPPLRTSSSCGARLTVHEAACSGPGRTSSAAGEPATCTPPGASTCSA